MGSVQNMEAATVGYITVTLGIKRTESQISRRHFDPLSGFSSQGKFVFLSGQFVVALNRF